MDNRKKIIIIVGAIILSIILISLLWYFYLLPYYQSRLAGELSNNNQIIPSSSSSTVGTPSSIKTNAPSIPTSTSTEPSLTLEDFNGGFFTIKKPTGWEIVTGGSCSTFSFVIKDKNNPARQIFYFGEVGPVYISQDQKTIDQQYMDMGGYKVEWFEMPTVNPLTPENFLKSVSSITSTNYLKKYMTQLPELKDLEIISLSDAQTIISGGSAKEMRALFRENNQLAEGLFYVTTKEMLPVNGMPDAGIGFGFSLTGVSAGKSEIRSLQSALTASLASFNLSQDYVSNCIAQQNQQYEAILKAGKTLSSISDTIMQSWETRNKSDDIIAEKRSDAMLGTDRVYDSNTETVYEVTNGWYDNYNINRQSYEMDNLQQLPNDSWNLWTAATHDGSQEIQ